MCPNGISTFLHRGPIWCQHSSPHEIQSHLPKLMHFEMQTRAVRLAQDYTLYMFQHSIQHHRSFKEAFVQINKIYGFLGVCLVKDINNWSELEAGTLRNHCSYLVRLWRKSKHRSKSIVGKKFGFSFFSYHDLFLV